MTVNSAFDRLKAELDAVDRKAGESKRKSLEARLANPDRHQSWWPQTRRDGFDARTRKELDDLKSRFGWT